MISAHYWMINTTASYMKRIVFPSKKKSVKIEGKRHTDEVVLYIKQSRNITFSKLKYKSNSLIKICSISHDTFKIIRSLIEPLQIGIFS